ncbi:MAG: ABC transporter substrate-binding protein [Eubacteriales bacterium]|nr:ABC transporter substrate-binding protein [Eubacteriales bacterium]
MRTANIFLKTLITTLLVTFPCAVCAQETPAAREETVNTETADWEQMTVERSMELLYADQFAVDYYTGEYALITIEDSGRFLVVPEGKEVPANLDEDVTVLQQPIENIYLVATSAMDLFCALDGQTQIRLSGTQASDWYVEKAREAMEAGDMIYAGKYSAPDYELIVSENCKLAVESTMIYHSPEVKEKLEEFGIPVLVERSSYESHPLGRTEWLKLYGVLLGKEELAEKLFAEQAEGLDEVMAQENTGKTVAFFYISSNGYVNVRKSGDYVSKMIELAGGKYIFDDLGDSESSLSTMNMQMEEFYARAKDADYIIYNSTIDGEIHTLQELFQKSPLLKDFKAVKEGNVYCTQKNLFQETMGLGTMIADMHTMLTGDKTQEFTYMYPIS